MSKSNFVGFEAKLRLVEMGVFGIQPELIFNYRDLEIAFLIESRLELQNLLTLKMHIFISATFKNQHHSMFFSLPTSLTMLLGYHPYFLKINILKYHDGMSYVQETRNTFFEDRGFRSQLPKFMKRLVLTHGKTLQNSTTQGWFVLLKKSKSMKDVKVHDLIRNDVNSVNQNSSQ